MKKAIKVWRDAFKILQQHPVVLFPFILSALFSALALYILYLAPQRPVSYLLAPPIRAFFGEKFLHFPSNLYLLPKLFSYGNLFVGATAGVLMSAVAVGILRDLLSGKTAHLWRSCACALRRYFSLLAIWFIAFFISFFAGKIFKTAAFQSLRNSFWGAFFYAVVMLVIQSIFIYLIPALIGKNLTLWGAIKSNFKFLMRAPFTTVVLVVTPVLVYVPYIILERGMKYLMVMFSPSVVVFVLGVNILVMFLMDIVITVSTTIFFLKEY